MTFEEWKDGYGLVLEPNYSKETEADCLAAFNFGKRQAADVIERQAAQIEMMREALSKIEYLESANGCIMSAGDCSSVATEALSSAPDQALEQFATLKGLK